MTYYKLIHADSVLVSQPILIREFGRVPALLVQQIHYWSQKGCGIIHHNQRWIYNTAEEWAEQLCVSSRTIKRAVQKLIKENIIFVKKLSKHKSDQTNSYTLNHEKLVELLKNCTSSRFFTDSNDNVAMESQDQKNILEAKAQPKISTEYNFNKSHRDILSQPSCHTDTMVIQKITSKDKNKSEFENVHQDAVILNEVVSSTKTTCHPNMREFHQQVVQVEDRMNASEEEVGEIPSKTKTTIAQDMISIWNKEVSKNKKNHDLMLNKSISKYLVASYQNKFRKNLDKWKEYCKLIVSSPYLMGKDFILSLNWALKYATIDRILAGELGVNLRSVADKTHSVEDMKSQALAHIDGVGESDACKAIRYHILKAVGACQYNAWFTKVDICDDGTKLKPHNRFVEEAIRVRFDNVLTQIKN